MAGAPLGVVASGFLQLLVSQIGTRVATFALNLALARRLTPEAYGLSAIQFHLLTTTILLLSREGFRRGCLRFKPSGSGSTSSGSKGKGKGVDADSSGSSGDGVDPEQVLSVAWLTVPVGLVVSALVCLAVIAWPGGSAQSDATPGYALAVALNGAATVVELLAEPLHIVALVQLRIRLRVFVDAAALMAKSLASLVLVSATPLPPAVAFGLAQLASALVSLVGYTLFALREGLLPKAARCWRVRWGPAQQEVLRMTGLFTLQAAEKQVLAEGSKMVMATLQSSYNQGVYGLVSNLGSLVVRTLFSPLEEVAFAAFSRARASAPGEAGAREQQGSGRAEEEAEAAQRQLHASLAALTKVVSLLGLLSAAFGPPYAYAALRLVYGPKWSESGAPAALAAYAVYILPLAMNGITEAFVHAVADGPTLQRLNGLLLAFAAAQLGASAGLAHVGGTVGLIAADGAVMALRTVTSLWLISRHFRRLPGFSLASLLPSPGTLAAAAACAAACAASRTALMAGVSGATPTRAFLAQAAPHIGVGACCLAALLAVAWRAERGTLRAVAALRGAKGAKQS